MNFCMFQMIHSALQREAEGDESERMRPTVVHVRRIYCRLYNYDPVTPLKKLKANFYGKYLLCMHKVNAF